MIVTLLACDQHSADGHQPNNTHSLFVKINSILLILQLEQMLTKSEFQHPFI